MGRYILWRVALMPRFLIGLLLLFMYSSAVAQPNSKIPETTLEIQSDWESGEVIFTLRSPVAAYIERDNAAPAYWANRKWQTELDEIVTYVLKHIPYDSTETLFSEAEQRGISRSVVEDVVGSIRLVYNGLSADFAMVEARYKLLLYPTIISYFSTARREVAERYNWIATTDYSGIVIIAQGALPLHNNTRMVRAKPVLSPTIYDEELRIVLQAAMVQPSTKEQRGIVGYDTEYSREKWRGRVGDNPLLLYASGVRDERGSNLIISSRDAQKILIREHNRNLIRDGKILMVLDEAIINNILTIDIY